MASHQNIAHRWAQDTGASLKGFNMYSEGAVIYSYGPHFPIARFVTAKDGRRVVLFNADSYSVSTSKHKSYTWRAIPQGVPVFEIPKLSSSADYSDKATGKEVIAAMVEEAGKLYAQGLRARTRAEWLYDQARKKLDDAGAFAAAFGHRWKRPLNLDVMGRELAAKAAKQAKAEAKARKEREARQAEEAKRQREIDAERFLAWRRGEPGSRVPYSWQVDDAGRCYVRRSPDGESLQTSQGADVPWSHAVKAFRFIRLCVERGEGWQRNGRTVRVGHYQIDSIDADGNMTAGCHRFLWDDMRALAEREGVFALSPSAEAVETREGVAH